MNNFKKNNELLLSICIFTYNQPKDLKNTLLSILPQISPELEIVIGDNSTNQETEELLKNEFTKLPIRYFHHPRNIGVDNNILFVTERARGKYVWLFGDDEMEPGAIKRVLNAIKKYSDISLIWINYHFLDNRNFMALNFGEDKFFEDKNEVLEKIANALGFCSAAIFKKEKIDDVDKSEMNKFVDSEFTNLYLVMHVLSKDGRVFYINQPYVCAHPRPADRPRFNGFEVFGINFFKVVSSFKNKFNKKSLKKMLAKNFGHVWRSVLVGWLKGYDSPKGRFWPIFKHYWNFPEIWIAGPLFLMPKFMTKLAYFFYKKVLKRTYSTVE